MQTQVQPARSGINLIYTVRERLHIHESRVEAKKS